MLAPSVLGPHALRDRTHSRQRAGAELDGLATREPVGFIGPRTPIKSTRTRGVAIATRDSAAPSTSGPAKLSANSMPSCCVRAATLMRDACSAAGARLYFSGCYHFMFCGCFWFSPSSWSGGCSRRVEQHHIRARCPRPRRCLTVTSMTSGLEPPRAPLNKHPVADRQIERGSAAQPEFHPGLHRHVTCSQVGVAPVCRSPGDGVSDGPGCACVRLCIHCLGVL